MRRAPLGCQRPYSPAITGQLLVGSAVLMCAAGLGAHLLCGARPSGTSASLPVIAGELLASSAVLLCTAGPGHTYHVACAPRGPTHPFASSCWSFAGGFRCVAVHCGTGGALIMWLALLGDHRPHSPAIAGQLLVSSAVLLCTAGLGTHSSCDMLPSGPLPALASHGWSVAR